MFQTIEEEIESEIVEKKSKFMAHLFPVESVEEAEETIKQVNKKYFDARHNCYAFRVMTKNGVVNRFSDDGEPSGTAGGPMLNILTAQNLCNILVVVTRYFGGILLGTGGLVKAYSSATMEALNQANLLEKELGKEVEFVVSYSDLEKLKYYLKVNEIRVSAMQYHENVSVIVDISEEKYEKITTQNLNFELLESKLIKDKFISV